MSASFKGSAGGECQPFCPYPALCWAAAQHFICVRELRFPCDMPEWETGIEMEKL